MIVIEDNNPNILPGMILCFLLVAIITLLVQIVILYRRRQRLIELHEKMLKLKDEGTTTKASEVIRHTSRKYRLWKYRD